MKSKIKNHLICRKCGASWDYTGTKTETICPYCGAKKSTRDRSEYTKQYAKSEARKETLKKWYSITENRKHRGAKQREILRKQVYFKVSGSIYPKCVRCGCDDPRILEINHKNGGGAIELRIKGTQLYHDIASGKRKTDDLELLCKPCNAIHYLELKFGKLPMRVIWEDSGQKTI